MLIPRSRCASRHARKSSAGWRTEVLESRQLLTLAVPALSSLPGANHTIYLDFDGHVVQNTNWNSYYNQTTLNAPAYNTDGNPADFGSAELAAIEDAWKRIAEDFRPFEVNVTTVDPGIEALRKSGSGDLQWGVRVIMSKESSFVTDPAERTGAGGIAYVNSFNWSNDTPAWVFTTGGKNIAEAASHEIGHSLGLEHDGLTSGAAYYQGHGSGETGWASIMGVGYYRNVTQWDRGEYYNSNNGDSGANYGSGPDDLAVIATTNGFGYRADDYGDSNASASLLDVSGDSVSDSGVIETSNDVDVLTFTTGAGAVTLNINPFTPGPNLDVKADLYDSTGSLVASSNPTASLSAGFSLNLAAGQYFLHIQGTGVGNPSVSSPSGYSDYASLGQYSVTGSIVDAGSLPQVSVSDVVVDESDGLATFTVTVSGTVTNPVTVDFATADGSAGAVIDYTQTSGSLSFAVAGSQTVSVAIRDDSAVENTEWFAINLTNVANAVVSDGQGMATITDNDVNTDANITINSVSANEGNLAKGRKKSGNPTLKNFVFAISLSNSVAQSVTVDFATADGSATVAGGDYRSASGSVTFAPGETMKTVSVAVMGDNTEESDETFTVILSNAAGGTITGAVGVGTILNDDASGGGTGGTGGGRNKKVTAGIAVADPLWWFEGPAGKDHLDHEAHDVQPDGRTIAGFGGLGVRSLGGVFDELDDDGSNHSGIVAIRTEVNLIRPDVKVDLDTDSSTDVLPAGGAQITSDGESESIDLVFAGLPDLLEQI